MLVISPSVSRHLQLLGLISSIFVVYIHATTFKYGGAIDADSSVRSLQVLLSLNMLHFAVAFFFLNASFFLFSGVAHSAELYKRMRKRVITLLMPYCFWSACWLFLVLGCDLFFGKQLIKIDGSILWNFLVDPLPGQLWFLRDLMLLVLLAPLFFWLNLYVLSGLTLLFMIGWLFSMTPTVISMRDSWYNIISNEALAWFLLGCVAARTQEKILPIIEKGGTRLVLVFLALAWVVSSHLPLPGSLPRCLSVFSGTLFLLLAIRLFAKIARHPYVAFLGGYGFLIYLAHHPLLGVLQSWIIAADPDSGMLHACVYLFVPLIVIAMIVVVFSVLAKYCGFIVYIANGGRNLQPFSDFYMR